MNVEEFVQNSISRSLSKYLELHPDVSIPTYVGSGWGVAKIGVIPSVGASGTTTINISELGLSSVDDYIVSLDIINGGEIYPAATLRIASRTATSFGIRNTSSSAYGAVYTVFAKGYGGVPNGGTTGQVLVKKSDTDGDTEWRDVQILESPNGTKYKLIVLNDGTLSTEAV